MAKKKRVKRATIRGRGHDLPIFDSMDWAEPNAVGDAGREHHKEQSREAKPKKPRRQRG